MSYDRYNRTKVLVSSDFELVKLKNLLEIQSGYPFDSKRFNDSTGFPLIRIRNIKRNNTDTLYDGEILNDYIVNNGDILIGMDGEFNTTIWNGGNALMNQRVCRITKTTNVLKEYVFHLIQKKLKEIEKETNAVTVKHISVKQILDIEIPLPPIEVQEEIVRELEQIQKIIDGAKQVVDNYRPSIDIDPLWKMKTLDEISVIVRGSSPRPQGDPKYFGGDVPRLMIADITRDGMYVFPQIDNLTELGATKSRQMKKGEVVIAVSGNPGLTSILGIDCCIHDGFVGFRELSKEILPEYLYHILTSLKENTNIQAVGAVFRNLTTEQLKSFSIPIPSLEIQHSIVDTVESERQIIDGNKKLIEIYTQKIQDRINKIWGE